MDISQAEKSILGIVDQVPKIVDMATVNAMQIALATFKRRIFTQGKDNKEGQIGTYKSKYYKKRREENNLITAYKNLSFNGTLENSVQFGTIQKGKTYVIGIVSRKSKKTTTAKIAGYQEQQTNKVIFKLSEKEKKEINTNIQKTISMYMKEIFKNTSK